jgi:hypothetical protein
MFGIGGSHSSSSSSMSSSSRAYNPTFVQPQLEGITNKISDTAGMDPYSFVAGSNPTLNAAAAGANGLGSDYLDRGVSNSTYTDFANNGHANLQDNVATVHGNSLLSNLQSYMDPYNQAVVDTTLAGFDRNAGTQQAQAALDLAGDSTFGGSGGALYKAKLASDQGLDRASTEAGLRSQGFTQATSLSADDANRRQQAQLANQQAFNSRYQFNAGQNDIADNRRLAAAAGLNTNANDFNTDARANINTMADIGGIMHGIDSEHAAAPLTALNSITGAYANMTPGLGLLHGEDTTGKSKGKSTTISASGSFG